MFPPVDKVVRSCPCRRRPFRGGARREDNQGGGAIGPVIVSLTVALESRRFSQAVYRSLQYQLGHALG